MAGPGAEREQWGSRHGFVLATIGSAVGLGNIWRFSYIAGENGGGAFLIIYLVCVVLVGAPIVIAEIALGRAARSDAVSAFAHVAPKGPWATAGWLGVAGAVLILSYYAVIAGWALKYFVGAAGGATWRQSAEEHGGFFASFIANGWEPVAWQTAMMLATMLIVMGGIQRGIEAVNRWLMPLLALIVLAIAVYGMTLPGGSAAWRFLLAPDWTAFARPEVYAAALGQAFFSLGVGMAIFVTYGSYMPRSHNLPRSVTAIVAGDTLFAIVAGLAIFQAVFAFGLSPAAGPELAFITLPQVFLVMPFGETVGTLFFFLLAAAALTSMISLLEVPVAYLASRHAMRRRPAVLLTGAAIVALGIPSALSFGLLAEATLGGKGFLDALDQTVSNYLLPLAGLAVALLVGWRWAARDALDNADLDGRRFGRIWLLLVRYLVPAMILLILYGALSGTWA